MIYTRREIGKLALAASPAARAWAAKPNSVFGGSTLLAEIAKCVRYCGDILA